MSEEADKKLEDLEIKMVENADILGFDLNDTYIMVKFGSQIDETYHKVEVNIDRKTGQMEVIKDENNIRKQMLESIDLPFTNPYNLMMVEGIINNIARTQLSKIKI